MLTDSIQMFHSEILRRTFEEASYSTSVCVLHGYLAFECRLDPEQGGDLKPTADMISVQEKEHNTLSQQNIEVKNWRMMKSEQLVDDWREECKKAPGIDLHCDKLI